MGALQGSKLFSTPQPLLLGGLLSQQKVCPSSSFLCSSQGNLQLPRLCLACPVFSQCLPRVLGRGLCHHGGPLSTTRRSSLAPSGFHCKGESEGSCSERRVLISQVPHRARREPKWDRRHTADSTQAHGEFLPPQSVLSLLCVVKG